MRCVRLNDFEYWTSLLLVGRNAGLCATLIKRDQRNAMIRFEKQMLNQSDGYRRLSTATDGILREF